MTRVESASSINTFKSCQRKYFYHYKLELPGKESVAAINGKAVHSALEHFFKIDPSVLSFNNYENELRNHLLNSFNQAWITSVPTLITLEEDKDKIKSYYEDSLVMLDHFIMIFLAKLKNEMTTTSLKQAFQILTPETEVAMFSNNHNVRGFIDAIHKNNGEILILDYKTTRSDEITEDYKLQLAIYTLLYQEQFGNLPHKVGLSFLRHGTEKYVPITEELLALAKEECQNIQDHTTSDNIEDYPKNLGPTCRWCDYKDICFGQKSLVDYQTVPKEGHYE